MGESLELFKKYHPNLEKGDYICPVCGEQTILTSGFSGNPFCWGRCYHYFNWKEIKKEEK